MPRRPLLALCREVLQTDYAVLAAAGALAPLVAQPLVYPAQAAAPAALPLLPATVDNPLVVAVTDPALPQVAWAVPLHGAQGPIGVLLLGRRGGDGLYTEEEIAIARATGERLLDLLAAAALARRLLALAREQWAEGQVADRQTRRVLHDEVLPDLHAARILLERNDDAAWAQAKDLVAVAHRQTADLLRALPLRPPTPPDGPPAGGSAPAGGGGDGLAVRHGPLCRRRRMRRPPPPASARSVRKSSSMPCASWCAMRRATAGAGRSSRSRWRSR